MRPVLRISVTAAAFAAGAAAAGPAYGIQPLPEGYVPPPPDPASIATVVFVLSSMGCVALAAVALGVLWIWMLIDALYRREHEFNSESVNAKMIWIVMLILFSGVAPIVYFFAVFRSRRSAPAAPGASGSPRSPTDAPHPPSAPTAS
jgi:formate hydrogenlyase subunit 3/multisubunit Na+/H+ antiporter MnhD subunit